ncbi:DUF938 domain-containing protein [Azohydromonas caseinilytica]|uniref:DUF938 domain-containing protein n=1 Tax=Azohydromonas caseinilytica TaxID=2728836 RepID=A0A848F9Y8_9BURK|nr:DUF938 domain-containing protein [Azohydromonas caseinilytica]NML15666.1 DUF938 domain-containing protein [Azohydromonas caseinilytica]
MNEDLRLHSPAAERNREPILQVLRRVLPDSGGLLLEIASGTGQHAAYLGEALPRWRWQPSDAEARSLPSIAAWCEGLPNVLPPLRLDVTAPRWDGVPAEADALFCANLLHIAPWACCAGLMQGAARHLRPGAPLLLYGPFIREGVPTAPSNLAFDADLRARDPAWGLRRLEDVADTARAAGLGWCETVAMPANNLLVVFERARSAPGSSTPG